MIVSSLSLSQCILGKRIIKGCVISRPVVIHPALLQSARVHCPVYPAWRSVAMRPSLTLGFHVPSPCDANDFTAKRWSVKAQQRAVFNKMSWRDYDCIQIFDPDGNELLFPIPN